MASSFCLQRLRRYETQGLVRSKAHPGLPLVVWNYTEKTQFAKQWDAITRAARALVLETDGRVVARSFPKFHNLNEGLHEPTPDFVVFEKLDGSLILVFWYNSAWQTASRGSFTSTQAEVARRLLDDYDLTLLDRDLCYSFEILYPENRIVVDYGQRRELVFLAAFDRAGKESLCNPEVAEAGFAMATQLPINDLRAATASSVTNAEGYVARFSNGGRVKMKFQEYCRLHKLVANLSDRGVWEWFKAGRPLQEVVETDHVPDEWHPWLKRLYREFQTEHDAKAAEVEVLRQQMAQLPTRKEVALALRGEPLARLVFKALDEKPLREALCETFKPKAQSQGDPAAMRRAATGKAGGLHVLSGLSGAGKSTRAKQLASDGAVIVSRDGFRRMLFASSTGDWRQEELVTKAQRAVARIALAEGLQVVIDDTNVSAKAVNGLLKDFPANDIQFELLDVPVEAAIRQDSAREGGVGREVIERQAKSLAQLRATFDFAPRRKTEEIAVDQRRPSAFVFDVDGTLAINTGRHPYDWSRVSEDKPDPAVVMMLRAVAAAGHSVIICTSRDGSCEGATRAWLATYDIGFDRLFIRPAGDSRPDWEVKMGFWRTIAASFNIVALVDDRDQVVRHGRALGLKVFQVAPGDF